MMSEFMKNLCKIAVPVALQSMLQASFSIIDQLMIGQLGETSISAVGLCGNYSLIFSVLTGAVSTVAGILIAQFIGAREEKEAWCSLTVSVTTALMISFVFLAASGIWPAQILSLYTSDEGILEAGTAYFRILAFSYVPMGLSSVLSAWLRAKRCDQHRTQLCPDLWKMRIFCVGNSGSSCGNPDFTGCRLRAYFYWFFLLPSQGSGKTGACVSLYEDYSAR